MAASEIAVRSSCVRREIVADVVMTMSLLARRKQVQSVDTSRAGGYPNAPRREVRRRALAIAQGCTAISSADPQIAAYHTIAGS
jgi:hypothetical protein